MKNTWWVELSDLDDDQKNIIDIPLNKNALIKGPPGSGKTNLLLLRANQLFLSGYKNILILVFTRTLKEFIVAGANQYSFSPNKVMTSIKWMKNILEENDERIERNQNFENFRLHLVENLYSLIKEDKIGYEYEAILIDEAQDFLPKEIQIFHKISKRIFAVADSRQKVYRGEDPIQTIERIVDQTHTLKYHYRNGLKICEFADCLAKKEKNYNKLQSTANYNEEENPSSVDIFQCSSMDDECKKIFDRIELQLKTFPNELIGVVCPRKSELVQIWDYVKNTPLKSKILLQTNENEYSRIEDGKPIVLCTVNSSKGLEFRAIHIAGCEYLKRFAAQRNMSFMGATRAKTSLSLYHIDDLVGFLEQAIVDINVPPEIAKPENLFGKEGA